MGASTEPIILAIDPGTVHMGVAVLCGSELLHHGVVSISPKLGPYRRLQEGRRTVLHFINQHKPSVLAIEKAFFAQNRNSALLNVLVDEIQALAREQRLEVVGFAPSSVKKKMTGNGQATKREVADAVVAVFPELGVYRVQPRKSKERYYGNMFDAVAIGLVVPSRNLGNASSMHRVNSYGQSGLAGVIIRR